ncbi:MAG: type II toxin-antitoxin system HicA family toxin [Candidatus Altiarchaeota archaeon]|nr:type II toxin-antitoxin system HicA family toxin [Candidatus Altiarchaeota archaeon]
MLSSDKILKRRGFSPVRQKGSHIALHKTVDEKTFLVVVPRKSPVKKGTLISILKQAGISKRTWEITHTKHIKQQSLNGILQHPESVSAILLVNGELNTIPDSPKQ